MNCCDKVSSVYTAYSKHFFFAKMLVSAFVLKKNYLPLNPFNNWEYFLDDMVERELVVRANNNLIFVADEVWTFGPISDGVFREVQLANSLALPIKHFSLGKTLSDIHSISADDLLFENEMIQQFNTEDIMSEFGLFNASQVVGIIDAKGVC